MRFLADGAVGHGAGFEAFDDGGPRFDFAERNRLAVFLELKETAQGVCGTVVVVHQIGKFLEPFGIVGADGFLQLGDGQRVQQMIFAVAPPLVGAADIQRQGFVGDAFRESRLMARADFAGDPVEVNSADPRGGAGEIGIDHAAVQSDGFKNLCAAIAVQGGDTHLGHDFEQSLVDGFDKILGGIFPFNAGEQFLFDHVVQDLADHVRIDRSGTVADQQGEMMYFARLAAFDNQSATCALKFADQVVVNGCGRQQRRDRRIFLIGLPVGKNQQRIAVFNRL